MHTATRSRYLEAVDAASEGATVVTVNTRAARHVIAGCDQRRVQSGAHAWTTPDVLPFASWLHRTFRSAQLSGASSAVLLNRLQWRKLWERVMWDTTRTSELLRPTIAADAAIEAWSLLHAYGIGLNDSAFNTTSESRQFRQWARTISRECETSGWLDEFRIPESLASVLAHVGHALPTKLVVYGFDSLTPQYLSFLNALRAHAVAVEGDSNSDAETLDTAVRIDLPDCHSELATAAAWARGILKQNPWAKIGVVIPDLASLRSAAEHVFSRMLHPASFITSAEERAFEISVGLGLADWPLTRTALLALRFSSDGLAFTELRELLLSPYLAGAVFEASGRAQLVRELAAVAPEHVTRRDLQALLLHKKLKVIDCPMLRTQLERFQRACDRTPDEAPFSAWTRLTTESLEALGWPGIRDGGRALDSTEYQVFNRWNDLLSEITSMDVIQGDLRFADAVSEIVRVASGAIFAPQNLGAPVQLMDAREAAGSTFDHLWVCGMSDDAWPARKSANPYIPAVLQRAVKIPSSSPVLALAEAQTTVARLAASAASVVFSAPQREDDRELRASSLIERIAKITVEDLTLDVPASCAALQAGAVQQEMDDRSAPPIESADVQSHGTTVLELQSNCPFWAFAQARLGAKQDEEPQPGLKATLRGELAEGVMQRIWEQLKGGFNLQNESQESIARIIANAVEGALDEHYPPSEDPYRVRFRELERKRLAQLAREWLNVERRRDAGFRVIGHQVKVSCEVAGFEVRGRIDRLDEIDGGFIVIDYKAGSAKNYTPSHWKSDRPHKPQLPLYTVALRREGREVNAVAFGILSAGECKFSGVAERKEILGMKSGNLKSNCDDGESTLSERVGTWERRMSRLASGFLSGSAHVDPKVMPGHSRCTCDHCHLHSACRIAEAMPVVADEEDSDE